MARSHSRGLLYTAPPETETDRGADTKADADDASELTTEAENSTAVPADD